MDCVLRDPPRDTVPDAIKKVQMAGVRVVMITGNCVETAAAISSEVGISKSKSKSSPIVTDCRKC